MLPEKAWSSWRAAEGQSPPLTLSVESPPPTDTHPDRSCHCYPVLVLYGLLNLNMYNDTPLSYFTCVYIEDRAEGLTWALTTLYSTAYRARTAYRAHTASGPPCVHIEDRAEGLTWALAALYSTAYRAHTASGPSCVHIECIGKED